MMDRYSGYYRLTYKFNASHNTSGREDGRHVHTFRLVILLMHTGEGFVDFYDFEQRVKSLVDIYRGSHLNDHQEFADMNPTIENVCTYFFDTLQPMFEESGSLKLVQVTLGDSPTQSFSVSGDYIVMNRPVSRERIMHLYEGLRAAHPGSN